MKVRVLGAHSLRLHPWVKSTFALIRWNGMEFGRTTHNNAEPLGGDSGRVPVTAFPAFEGGEFSFIRPATDDAEMDASEFPEELAHMLQNVPPVQAAIIKESFLRSRRSTSDIRVQVWQQLSRDEDVDIPHRLRCLDWKEGDEQPRNMPVSLLGDATFSLDEIDALDGKGLVALQLTPPADCEDNQAAVGVLLMEVWSVTAEGRASLPMDAGKLIATEGGKTSTLLDEAGLMAKLTLAMAELDNEQVDGTSLLEWIMHETGAPTLDDAAAVAEALYNARHLVPLGPTKPTATPESSTASLPFGGCAACQPDAYSASKFRNLVLQATFTVRTHPAIRAHRKAAQFPPQRPTRAGAARDAPRPRRATTQSRKPPPPSASPPPAAAKKEVVEQAPLSNWAEDLLEDGSADVAETLPRVKTVAKPSKPRGLRKFWKKLHAFPQSSPMLDTRNKVLVDQLPAGTSTAEEPQDGASRSLPVAAEGTTSLRPKRSEGFSVRLAINGSESHHQVAELAGLDGWSHTAWEGWLAFSVGDYLGLVSHEAVLRYVVINDLAIVHWVPPPGVAEPEPTAHHDVARRGTDVLSAQGFTTGKVIQMKDICSVERAKGSRKQFCVTTAELVFKYEAQRVGRDADTVVQELRERMPGNCEEQPPLQVGVTLLRRRRVPQPTAPATVKHVRLPSPTHERRVSWASPAIEGDASMPSGRSTMTQSMRQLLDVSVVVDDGPAGQTGDERLNLALLEDDVGAELSTVALAMDAATGLRTAGLLDDGRKRAIIMTTVTERDDEHSLDPTGVVQPPADEHRLRITLTGLTEVQDAHTYDIMSTCDPFVVFTIMPTSRDSTWVQRQSTVKHNRKGNVPFDPAETFEYTLRLGGSVAKPPQLLVEVFDHDRFFAPSRIGYQVLAVPLGSEEHDVALFDSSDGHVLPTRVHFTSYCMPSTEFRHVLLQKIWEHQRFSVLRADWGATDGYLDAGEFNFTTTQTEVDTGADSFEDLVDPPPKDFELVEDWHLWTSDSNDADAWMYAPTMHSEVWLAHPNRRCYVRTRCWQRKFQSKMIAAPREPSISTDRESGTSRGKMMAIP